MKRDYAAERKKAAQRSKYDFMVNVTLDHDLDEFLDNVGITVKRSGGHKLPKTRIFRGLARVLKELIRSKKIDLSGVKTEEEFMERLMEAFKGK